MATATTTTPEGVRYDGTLLGRARHARAEEQRRQAEEQREKDEREKESATSGITHALQRSLGVVVQPEQIEVRYEGFAWRPFVVVEGLTFSAWYDKDDYRWILQLVRPCAKCGEPAAQQVWDLATLADLVDAPAGHMYGCPRDEREDGEATAPTAPAIDPVQRLRAALIEIADGAPEEDPGEGTWGSLEDAYEAGVSAQHFDCAQIARAALAETEATHA